jgi:hypothetical protein
MQKQEKKINQMKESWGSKQEIQLALWGRKESGAAEGYRQWVR